MREEFDGSSTTQGRPATERGQRAEIAIDASGRKFGGRRAVKRKIRPESNDCEKVSVSGPQFPGAASGHCCAPRPGTAWHTTTRIKRRDAARGEVPQDLHSRQVL